MFIRTILTVGAVTRESSDSRTGGGVERQAGQWWLHGMCLNSTVVLPCIPAGHPATAADVVFDSAPASPVAVDPQVLFRDHQLEIWKGASPDERSTIVARYPRFGLAFIIRVDPSSGSLRISMGYFPATEPGDWASWLPVLFQGAVMTVVVVLSGKAAFHANTVAVDGEGVLVGGLSGAGKTVTTALLALTGATLVADDVSVLESLRVKPGLLELRIRTFENRVGQSLVDQLCESLGASQRATVDHRIAVRFAQDPVLGGTAPSKMLLPVFDDAVETPQLVRLHGIEALTALLPLHRLVGWVDPIQQAADFGHCADLVDHLPVHRLVMPRLTDDPGNIRETSLRLAELIRSSQ